MKGFLKLLFGVVGTLSVVFIVFVIIVLVIDNASGSSITTYPTPEPDPCIASVVSFPGYVELAKFSGKYTGQKFRVSGQIVQVSQKLGEGLFNIRLGLDGWEKDVVYLTNFPDDISYGRPLEEERVDGYAVSTGEYTYTATSGKGVTIPLLVWCDFSHN